MRVTLTPVGSREYINEDDATIICEVIGDRCMQKTIRRATKLTMAFRCHNTSINQQKYLLWFERQYNSISNVRNRNDSSRRSSTATRTLPPPNNTIGYCHAAAYGCINHSLRRHSLYKYHDFNSQDEFLFKDRQYNAKRCFSSNQLLGHSPMSNHNSSIMNPGGTAHMGIAIPDSTYIPTAYEAIIGNVWQASTWRRDKLSELKGELNVLPEVKENDTEQFTLDHLATERQKLDLHLVDGIHLIVKHVEESIPLPRTVDETSMAILDDIILRMEQKIDAEMGVGLDHQLLLESDWNRVLLWLQKEIEMTLATSAAIQPKRIYFPIRDYMNVSLGTSTPSTKDADKKRNSLLENDEFIKFAQQQEQAKIFTASSTTEEHEAANLTSLLHPQVDAFYYSVVRYQLHITLAIVHQLQLSWKNLTTMSDQDIDRAAVLQSSKSEVPLQSIPAKTLIQVIKAYLIAPDDPSNDPCDRRLDALWNLIDKDSDGLIDQVEMNQICTIAVKASQNAIRQFVQEVVDVVPLDHQPQLNDANDDANITSAVATIVKKDGWFRRRRKRNEKVIFTKRLDYALQNHFDNELEMPHRLRCIYTWSNKKHQDNKISSILVQEDGGGIVTSVVGKKRYVELYPKIAIQEFREVQQIHFPQLNSIGQEYMKSFREELWILQGKGRQNRELQRDCTLFLVGVCIIDYIVLSI